MNNKIREIIAFVSGDVLTTVSFVYYSIDKIDWIHPLLKVLLALFVGIFGGIGGLVGKDIYEWVKKKVTNEGKDIKSTKK